MDKEKKIGKYPYNAYFLLWVVIALLFVVIILTSMVLLGSVI